MGTWWRRTLDHTRDELQFKPSRVILSGLKTQPSREDGLKFQAELHQAGE